MSEGGGRHAARRRARAVRQTPARTGPRHAARSVGREIAEWVVTLALAAGIALGVNTWVGGLVTVQGESMMPTLLDKERVLVGKVEFCFAKPERGEIVIVKYPDRTDDIIKRVLATAGERVAVSGGSAYINGKKLNEPYIAEAMLADFPEQTVPEGHIFVMGDNRNDSHDSRSPDVGPIPLNRVESRAYWVVWPLDKMKKLTDYSGNIAQ